MLYLAQVRKNDFASGLQLQLLAEEKSQNIWEMITQEELILAPKTDYFCEGMLVLAEITQSKQIFRIQNAKDWVLDLVQKFLTSGITPNFLETQAQQAEQWRQELTLQSQELARKTLEIEARREQLQNLQEELIRKEENLRS